MSTVATAQLPISVLDDDAWDDLLSFIEERRVIPIIGPELLQVATDKGPRLLYDWLAEKLAARLHVDTTQLPRPYPRNDVVCWFLGARGRREEAYVRLRGILKDAAFEPPQALRRLAAIPEFDLFVSTTFDPLLDGASPTLRTLHDVRLWRERVRQALRTSAAPMSPVVLIRGAG